jgi:hypothetical protein
MMKMSSDKTAIWTALKAEPFASGFRRVDSIHLLDFYLGYDAEGHHALLINCKDQPQFQYDLKSIRIFSSIRDDGRWSWFFVLEDPGLFELFSLFCEDLIESSRPFNNYGSAFKFVLSRLVNWRLLFERKDLGLLSENQLRGLCGELIHLKQLIGQFGDREAVASWVGPLHADQDFRMVDTAWEIKTLRPGLPNVAIASENQLDTSDRTIMLVLFELAACSSTTDGALTLNKIVDEVHALLVSDFDVRLDFDRLLFRSGYIRRSEYDGHYLVLRDCVTYDIKPEFPRITPSSLPAGISNVSYKLDLLKCEQFKVL